ncbi:MAG: hypothetical protein DMF80_15690 [Acidobacteria bacterium]|nr:MAG: hypothetical protein DMF80_15690 [Acidobacteriota bacterium]
MRGALMTASAATDGTDSTASTGRPRSRATASAALRASPFSTNVPAGKSRPPAPKAAVARRTSPPAFQARLARRKASLERGERR